MQRVREVGDGSSKLPGRGGRIRITVALPVLAATAITTVLVFHGIGAESLSRDESASLLLARTDPGRFLRFVTGPEVNQSLFYLVLRAWVWLGISEETLRILPALFAIATTPVLYALAHRLLGSRVAAIASVMLAANAFFIRYGQEARGYSLAVFLVTVSTYLLVVGLERRRLAVWVAYALVSTASLYAHVFAAFVLLAHVAAVLALPTTCRTSRAFVVSQAVVGVLAAPLALTLLEPGRRNIDWIPPPTLRGLIAAGNIFAGGGPVLAALFSALLVWTAVIVIRTWWQGPWERWPYLLLSAWLVTPPLASLAISVIKPIFWPRFLIVALPAFIVLAALPLARVRSNRLLATALVVVLAASGHAVLWQAETPTNEDWRSATMFVLASAEPDDAIFFIQNGDARAFAYYVERLDVPAIAPRCVYPEVRWGAADPIPAKQPSLGAALASVPGVRRLWLVTVGPTASPKPLLDQLLQALRTSHVLVDTERFEKVDVSLFVSTFPG